MVDKFHVFGEKFKAMYLRGVSYEEISLTLGIHYMTLRDWRKRMGLPPRSRESNWSWKDVPIGTGLSPREVLKSVAAEIGITKNDIEFILTRVEKLKSKGLIKGRSCEHVILAAAFLYLRWEGSGRRPLSADQFARICREFGLTKPSLLMTIRPFMDAGLYPKKMLLPGALLDRLWKSFQDKYGLTEIAKGRILELAKEPKIKYRTPNAVLAGCAYIACMETGKALTQEELSQFFGVTTVSIRNIINILRETHPTVRAVIGYGGNYGNT